MPDELETRPSPAMTSDPLGFLAVQRAGLQALLDMSDAAVTPVESEIEGRYRRACVSPESTAQSMLAEIEARFEEQLAAVERTHVEQVAQIEAEYESAIASAADKTRAALAATAARAQELESAGRKQMEDRLLLADTMTEATLKRLGREFQTAGQHAIEGHRHVELLRGRALALLGRYGISIAADAVSAPAAGEQSPDAKASHGLQSARSRDSMADYERHAQAVAVHLDAVERLWSPRLFVGVRPYVLQALLCVLIAGGVGLLCLYDPADASIFAMGGAIALPVTVGLSWLIGRAVWQGAVMRMQDEYVLLDQAAAAAGRALDQHLAETRERRQRDQARAVEVERGNPEKVAAQRHFETFIAEARRRDAEDRDKAQAAHVQRQADIQHRRELALKAAAERKDRRCNRLRSKRDHAIAEARQACEQEVSEARAECETARAALHAAWTNGLTNLRRLIEESERLGAAAKTTWTLGEPTKRSSLDQFAAPIALGHWNLDLGQLSPAVRELAGGGKGVRNLLCHAPSGPLPGKRFLTPFPPAEASTPALLLVPGRCALFLQAERAGRPQAIAALRLAMVRLLTSLPPGRVRFTIIDPIGLGESFAGFMHLADYEEALVGGRIWTESEHIEARLTELTSHRENVIQKYLRNEFDSIDAYNRQAGELAEPYRFLVIADFPAGFTEAAAHRLASIVSSGARCGVFTLIAHDQRLPLPPGLHLEDLVGESLHLVCDGERFVAHDELLGRFPLVLDDPPSEEMLTQIMHQVGRGAKDALRVEVPFDSIVPPVGQRWTRDAGTELAIPVGHTGAVRLQHFRLGRGITQHALVAGKTGSGKSTLLHVIVTNLALWYSPEEIELYLVDFKKGVEFKTYVTHALPHARAIAIESDREFGVSVLQRLDAEMTRRGDLFRAAGVQDLPAYRAASKRVLPRTLLIVDEFQVFFTEDDKLAQDAGVLLDRLVRQGRAFGIHVLLGSQTLGGSAGLARGTMGQMAVRIALQCSEADSQLILDDTNVAARLLTRPGEAIYNDAGGQVAGNSIFQVAWLSDERQGTYLEHVRELARTRGWSAAPTVVFEGNAPADIRQNGLIAHILDAPEWPARAEASQVWLGEAVAIKDPTSVAFRRQSGANLLFVGQRDDAALAMLAAAMLCLGAQHAPGTARFVILGGAAAESPAGGGLQDVAALLPHPTQWVDWRDVPDAIAELAGETKRRLEDGPGDAPAVYLLIYGLQRYRVLRRREDSFRFSASDEEASSATDRQFAELLREGPAVGVHVLVWSDTLATLERTLDRQALREFDNRVLFQMSAADSSNLIDTPEANRLGLYRALLFSEDRGLLEKFRPYGTLDGDWLAYVRQRVERKQTEPPRSPGGSSAPSPT